MRKFLSQAVNTVKDYLHFTNAERNGIFILLTLIFVTLIVPHYYPVLFPSKAEFEISEFRDEIVAFQKMKDDTKKQKSYEPTSSDKNRERKKKYPVKENIVVQLQKFDPNLADEELLKNLGIPNRAVQNLMKYRKKGGRVKKKTDFKKIYGITDSLYQQLEPYIAIADVGGGHQKSSPEYATNKNSAEAISKNDSLSNIAAKKSDYKSYKKTPLKIMINSAGEEEWQRLYGIGPAFSKRIVKFRNALGGFHKVEQIGEVYGLPDSTFQKIKEYLFLDETTLNKISINEVTDSAMRRHPYLDWKTSRAITNYRFQHGSYSNSNDLRNVKLLNDELIEMILPYLSFDKTPVPSTDSIPNAH